MIFKLFGQREVCRVVLRTRDKSRRVAVYSVYYARTGDPVYRREAPRRMIKERADESPALVARRRMDYHPGTLVYDYDIAVFINDVERDILRLDFEFLYLGEYDRYLIPRGKFSVFGNRLSAYRDGAVLDQLLRGASRYTRALRNENVRARSVSSSASFQGSGFAK